MNKILKSIINFIQDCFFTIFVCSTLIIMYIFIKIIMFIGGKNKEEDSYKEI